MSFSRILSAIGAAMIALGTAGGMGDIVGVKWALGIVALGGAIGVFTERLQGGVSDPVLRAEAQQADLSK
jgi:UPF0716 family protein affecting phage T7 exclusion